jgi:hypothetical protein
MSLGCGRAAGKDQVALDGPYLGRANGFIVRGAGQPRWRAEAPQHPAREDRRVVPDRRVQRQLETHRAGEWGAASPLDWPPTRSGRVAVACRESCAGANKSLSGIECLTALCTRFMGIREVAE